MLLCIGKVNRKVIVPIMTAPDRLGEHLGDVDTDQTRTGVQMLVLGDGVGSDEFGHAGSVDVGDGGAGEDAVGDEGDDVDGAGGLKLLGGKTKRAAGICLCLSSIWGSARGL
jgi:hypothetical protein